MTTRDYYPPSINGPIVDEILSGRVQATVLQVDRSSERLEIRVTLEVHDEMTPMNGADSFMGLNIVVTRHEVLVSEHIWDRLMKVTGSEHYFAKHKPMKMKFDLTVDTG